MNGRNEPIPSIPKRTWAITAIAAAGAFIAMLDSTVANLAVESIREEFSSTLSIIQWVVTGYLCALAISLPAAAWLGARFGYGRVWAGSLAVFVVASALCASAVGPFTLIAARFVQGLAGGLMVPAGQAVIGSTVEKRQLGRIYGVLGLVVALGPAIGPAVGGYILDTTSWRWLFLINLPIGLAALIAARGLVPGGSKDSNRSLDQKGLLLLGIGLPLLLFGSTEISLSNTTPLTILAAGVGVALAITFGIAALRANNPLIDIRLFSRKTFSAATFATGLTSANMYGGLLLIPLYLQLVADQGLAATGLWLLVMGLGSALALPIAGALTDRYGAGVVTLAGASLLLVSTLPFLSPSVASYGLLAATLLARGVGIALAQMPAMTAAYTSVSGEEMGDATTLVNIVQRIGGAMGAVGIVVILQQGSDSWDVNGYIWAFTSLAVLSVLTLLTAAIMRRQPELQTIG